MGGAKHAEVSYVPLTCQDVNREVGHGDKLHGPVASLRIHGKWGEGVGVVPNTSPLKKKEFKFLKIEFFSNLGPYK